MNNAFPASDFDEWAEQYDQSVGTEQAFPFFDYESMLGSMVKLAEPRRGMRVLDLGTGTGNLALRFKEAGCEVWGTDFSPGMLRKAREKIPEAHFHLHDLHTPLPDEVRGPFERIVSTYVFHHFPLAEKVRILDGLKSRLKPGGCILIGDIAFQNAKRRNKIKREAGEHWEEEYYWLADETLEALGKAGWEAKFTEISRSEGIFLLMPGGTSTG